MLAYYGPIAQLGERFNGIEEVKGSSPFRSIEAHLPLNYIPQPPRPSIHQGTDEKGFFVSTPLPLMDFQWCKKMKGLYCGKTKAESIG